MINSVVKLFQLINSEQSSKQIAVAITLAFIVGMTPLLSLHNLLVLFTLLFFRVHIGMFLLAWPLFAALGIVATPLLQNLGEWLLLNPALVDMWQSFYNTLLGRWSNFYYPNLMGGLLISVALSPFIYLLSNRLIAKYRNDWLKYIEKVHLVKILKASRIGQLLAQKS
ncbi:MAG: TIGR03546 family protein [Kangiellaceae bacterium]|jgi:uncharacterized protein (TIGR03546 family)|nr:TIGR03546 family protein [Kangiellaceae bacterium]